MNIPVGFDKDDIINPYDKNISGYHFSDPQRILELSDKNSIFCKEFKRHFVNINVPTLLIHRQVYLLAYRHLRCPEVFTCEIEKDDNIDPFDK